MNNVCAWCGKALEDVNGGRERINFGICPACLPEWREEMAAVIAHQQEVRDGNGHRDGR